MECLGSFPIVGAIHAGMPIKACADRLRGEIEAYGNPPAFPEESEEASAAAAPTTAGAAPPVREPGTFKATKSKAVAKKGKGATQWDILKNSGVPEDEIHQFQCELLLCHALTAPTSSFCSCAIPFCHAGVSMTHKS